MDQDRVQEGRVVTESDLARSNSACHRGDRVVRDTVEPC